MFQPTPMEEIYDMNIPEARRYELLKQNVDIFSQPTVSDKGRAATLFKCPFCFYETRKKQDFIDHFSTNHMNVRHPCEICNETFASVKTLKGHVKYAHPSTSSLIPETPSRLLSQDGILEYSEVEVNVSVSPTEGGDGTEIKFSLHPESGQKQELEVQFSSDVLRFSRKAVRTEAPGQYSIVFPQQNELKERDEAEFSLKLQGFNHNNLHFKWNSFTKLFLGLSLSEPKVNLAPTPRGTPKLNGAKWFTAAIEGNLQAIQEMLDSGQFVDAVATRPEDFDGVDIVRRRNKTALLLASNRGHLEIMNLLLEYRADIDYETSGWSALHEAAQGYQLKAAILLIKKGCKLDQSNIGYTPLTVAATQSPSVEMVQLLLHHGAKVEGVGNETLLKDPKVDEKIKAILETAFSSEIV